MNIFSSLGSVFTLGGALKDVFSRENIEKLLNYAKGLIVEYVDKKDLLGPDKKKEVDAKVLEWIAENMKSKNNIVQWIIDNIVVPLVPAVTQIIYDCLKKLVAGLTE